MLRIIEGRQSSVYSKTPDQQCSGVFYAFRKINWLALSLAHCTAAVTPALNPSLLHHQCYITPGCAYCSCGAELINQRWCLRGNKCMSVTTSSRTAAGHSTINDPYCRFEFVANNLRGPPSCRHKHKQDCCVEGEQYEGATVSPKLSSNIQQPKSYSTSSEHVAPGAY